MPGRFTIKFRDAARTLQLEKAPDSLLSIALLAIDEAPLNSEPVTFEVPSENTAPSFAVGWFDGAEQIFEVCRERSAKHAKGVASVCGRCKGSSPSELADILILLVREACSHCKAPVGWG